MAHSKEEYLKRYLSTPSSNDKRKKRPTPAIQKKRRVKIVDDDVDFKTLAASDSEKDIEEYFQENKPTVAEFIDERPQELQQLERFRQNRKWRLINKDTEQATSGKTEHSQGKDLNHSNSDTYSPRMTIHDSDRSPPRRSTQDSGSKQFLQRGKRHDLDSDNSLPRQNSDFGQSPGRIQTYDSESDESIPKRRRQDSNSDQSPPRKKRHDSGSDQSPPRRRRKDSGSDQSSPRRRRKDSGSDQSPSRRRKDSGSDQSPPRRRRKDSGSDQSPPRRRRKDSGSDQSPPRRKRTDSDSDQSPPRRRKDSGSDQSPPRRKRTDSDSDQSPPRKRRQDSDSDQSPPRKRRQDSDSEHSSRKNKRHPTSSSDHDTLKKGRRKRSRWSEERVSTKELAKKTLSGAKAGLSTAQEMKQESIKLRQLENKRFTQMDQDVLGKDAKTVFRDRKSGKRRNLAEEAKQKAEENAEKAKTAEIYGRWGKGLKQDQMQQEAVSEALREAEKPLARYRDDKDMDDMLRNVERDGDPMLAYIQKKKKQKGTPGKKALPRYSGREPPPNRFGIWPGYRWDGVDRSNGFEKKLFTKMSEKKAINDMAYKWSVEDM